MKKEIKIAIIILIGFLSFLWIEKPLREYLSLHLFEEKIAKQISKITIRTILIIASFVMIKKLRLIDFTGLNSWKTHRNIHAPVIAFVFIIFGIAANWSTYKSASIELLFLYAISVSVVGIFEEFLFRGAIFPLFIKSFDPTNKPILISAVLSSLMFGIVHFINLFSQPENIIGITSQVFFATSIGVFFCGLMVRTENILIPIIVHALVNFSFGAGELKQSIEENSDIEKISGINWSSLVPTTIFFSFIFIGGMYMILKTDKEKILNTLKKE